jgi:Low specificity phosphatase (HAD superfamily)
MELADLEGHFVDLGGQFVSSAYSMREKLREVKAYVFDWDGVFNQGTKGVNRNSDFNEVDSMGANMMRYGHFRQFGQMPLTAVITGEDNPSAVLWSRREHLHGHYALVKRKEEALEHFCQAYQLEPKEICFFYDDILDLPIAEKVGLRLAVGRLANPLFIQYLIEHKAVDYISACQGNEHAVREFSELLLALMGQHYKVIESRAKFDAEYRNYLEQRQHIHTQFFRYEAEDNAFNLTT